MSWPALSFSPCLQTTHKRLSLEAAIQSNGVSAQKVNCAKLTEFSSLQNKENVICVPGKTCPFVLLLTIDVIYSTHCSDFLNIHVIVCHNQSFMCIRCLCLGGNRLASNLPMKPDITQFKNVSIGKNVLLERNHCYNLTSSDWSLVYHHSYLPKESEDL